MKRKRGINFLIIRSTTYLYIRGMKQFFVSSLFLFLTCIVHGNTPFQNPIVEDSLQKYRDLSRDKNLSVEERLGYVDRAMSFGKEISDSVYLSQLQYKSFIYSSVKDFDKALEMSTLLLQEANRLESTYYRAFSYEKLGRYNSEKQNDIEAFKNYVKAIELYTQIQDSVKIIKTSKQASFVQSQIGDLEGTEYTIVNALDYSAALDDVAELAWFYDVLGRVYRERSLWQQAIQHHRRALQLENSPQSKVSLLNNYAITLINAGLFEDARVQLSTALAYDKEMRPSTLYRLLDNLAFAEFKLEIPRAIDNLENALRLRQEINDLSGQYASHLHLSEAYNTMGNNAVKARYHAQQAYDIATVLGNTEAIVRALDFLIPVTKRSNTLFEEYSSLSDSLTAAKNKAKFEFAKLRYDVEKAEERESIALNQISESELREEKAIKRRNWAFAGLLLFVVMGSLLVLYQRERSKKSRILDRYDTEKRLAKKLHDELANEIYLVMSQLETEESSLEVADKLEHIYKLSRDISRDTQPIHTDETFPEELAHSLQSYTNDDRKLILRGLESIDWNAVDATKKIEIYRVLQELMTNMRKHSKASFVALVFDRTHKFLEINYSDNGRGSASIPIEKGGGLANIESRLKTIKGEVRFDSDLDEGFRAEISIPI